MEKYEKIRVVGRGAYGTVFLCRRIADRKLIIIKQIPVEQMTKAERQAALNEVKVLSMLDHPNIIEYYENFLEDKALMIVMEYAQGGTLFEYLQSRKSRFLDEEEILSLFTQMLLSLQHVHSKQILHRDLKTQNILLDKRRQQVKVGDFGISKVLSSKSKAYTVVGTPCYISPELCEGKPYNQKSDIWALGCILYELSSLRRAFEAQNLPALVLRIMRGSVAPISDTYSEALRQLILSMLHLDPARRPTINQIMALPIISNSLMNLYTDFGKVPCRRVPRPLSTMPGQSRPRVARGSKGSANTLTLCDGCLPTPAPAISSVFCWGGGLNAPTELPLPSSDVHVVEVSTGRTQKAAVTKNGRLLVWEAQAVGLDIATLPGAAEGSNPAFVPRYLEGQSAVTIQHVSCGDLFTACLTDRGILMTYGSGANGCLGHGNYNDVTQAKIVEELLGFEVIMVSCGASHVLAVTNEHEVFAWGRGHNGRLGLSNTESYASPQEVVVPAGMLAKSVHCGLDSTMLLTIEGKLLCCGSNRDNKLGLDLEEHIEEVHTFTSVRTLPLPELQIRAVAMGTSHAAIVTECQQCYVFGSNQFGQLGQDDPETNEGVLHPIAGLDDAPVAMVACGDTFTVAVNVEGDVFSWGKSARGRLGRPNEATSVPGPVTFPEELKNYMVTSISSSHGSTVLAVTSQCPIRNAVD